MTEDNPGPCALCKTRRIVMEHPHRAEVCGLGEGPGRDEDRKGVPFVGRSGSEYNHLYLPCAGLTRSLVSTHNAVCCKVADSGKAPSPELVSCCSAHWLPWFLRRVRPSIIIAMGGTALSLFPGHDLELEHGRPFQGSLTRQVPTGQYREYEVPGKPRGRGKARVVPMIHIKEPILEPETYWEGTVFPTYHPAAGLHASEFMEPLLDDFRALGDFLRGRLHVPQDEHPNPDYALCKGYDSVSRYLYTHLDWALAHSPFWRRPLIGRDTETTPPLIDGAPQDPYCCSLSLFPGTGRVILADDKDGLQALRDWSAKHNPVELWHNGLFDLPITDAMRLPAYRGWKDTMVMAYHQARLPKGLKVLAYRELGVPMLEFDDLVRPWWLLRVAEYLRLVEKGDWEHLRAPRQVGLDKRVARLLRDLGPDLKGETDPKERWENLPDVMRVAAEEAHGPLPVKSIALVPITEVVPYAARDADVALRAFLKVLHPRLNLRLKPDRKPVEEVA